MTFQEYYDLREPLELKPCPFCGCAEPGNKWGVDEILLNRTPDMSGRKSALISVRLRHWCGAETRTMVECTGRDHADLEEKWNRRERHEP